MGGGSGIHYSKFSPLIISLKFWVIHYNKTNYSLFINFFFNSLKKVGLFIILGPQYALFIIFWLIIQYSL